LTYPALPPLLPAKVFTAAPSAAKRRLLTIKLRRLLYMAKEEYYEDEPKNLDA